MCPPCVIWTTHHAVVCVLHAIQKLFVQTCVSTGVWRLCVWQILSSVRQWRHVFMSEIHSEVLLWFLYFCLGCRRGPVSSQIYIYGYIYTRGFYFAAIVVLERGAMLSWSVVLLLSLTSTLTPLRLCCQFFSWFFFTWSVSPCVLCVAPKCSEILLGTVMLNSQDFSSCECFGCSFSNSSPWGCQCFSLLFECISYHPSICMHVENTPRCRTGSTLSLFLSLINLILFISSFLINTIPAASSIQKVALISSVALFYHIMLVGMILESNNLPVYIF